MDNIENLSNVDIKRGGLRVRSAATGVSKKVMSSKHSMFRHMPSSSSLLFKYKKFKNKNEC